jgi:hypothetical protein
MERFVWAELADIHLANGAAYGNGREAQRIYHRVRPIVVRSLLSTVAYGKLVLHLQLTGTAQGEEDQFARLNLMKFYSVLRRNPPQAPVRLFTQSEWVVVLCGTLYASRSSILSIGKRCRLYWAPTITFVETNLFVGLLTSIQRSPTFPQWCVSRMMPASPEREFSTATIAMLGQKQILILHLLTATTNNALWSTFGRALLLTF